MTFKIKKGYRTYYKNFNTIEEAQQWGGVDAIVELSDEQIILSNEEKLKLDKDFGEYLINEFLIDNRISPSVTSSDSLNLLNKFNDIEKLARLGDIITIKTLLINLQVDSVFTQERKDKYLELINRYLGLI